MRTLLLSGATLFALSQSVIAQGPAATAESFIEIHGPGYLSSQVVGLRVYNEQKQAIGQIEDIAMSEDGRTKAYILSAGRFLGVGEHYVAVNPAAVKIGYSESDRVWHASMNATLDQLKAAPKYQYPGHIGEKACINILQ